MEEVIIGKGQTFVATIIGDGGREGILLRRVAESHEIGSKEPTWHPDEDVVHHDTDIVLWLDNIEGARVLQERIAIVCLRLAGYEIPISV